MRAIRKFLSAKNNDNGLSEVGLIVVAVIVAVAVVIILLFATGKF